VAVVRRLLTAGHSVVVHDPAVSPEQAAAAVAGVRFAERAEDVFEGADAVAVATDWPEFAGLDLAALGGLMRRPLLYDGRNLFDPAAVTAAGLSYRGIGRVDAEPRSRQPTGEGGAGSDTAAPAGSRESASSV